MDVVRNRRRNLCIWFIAANLLFIWGNSLLPGHISAAISRFVGNVLSLFFSAEGPEVPQTGHGLLRKLAHFLEFLSLGFLLSLLLHLCRKPYLFSLPLGAFAGAVDECIQLLVPDRGPHIRDVGIDTLGVVAGIGVFTVVLAARKRKTHTNLEETKQ